MTKPFMEMELRMMNSTIPSSNLAENDEDVQTYTAITKNLHKTCHAKKCFKDKKSDCRMKIPQPPQESFTVAFDEKKSKWFTWKGEQNDRFLFLCLPQRGYADMFANIYNSIVSQVFRCNNNIVACVDGASPIYLTLYPKLLRKKIRIEQGLQQSIWSSA
jgi:hypothetical protein